MPPRRKRQVSYLSDEEDGVYPEELLASAALHDDESPVKRQKYILRPAGQNSRQHRQTLRRPTEGLASTVHGPREGDKTHLNSTNNLTLGLEELPRAVDGDEWDLEINGIDGDGPFKDTTTTTENLSGDEALDLFVEAVSNGVAGFKHVHSKYCVVQGWDYQRHQATVRDVSFFGITDVVTDWPLE